MGKGDAGSARETAQSQAKIAGDMSGLAKSLLAESAPYRKQAGEAYSGIVSGDPASLSKVLGPQYTAIDRQYGAAQREAEATMPSGGGLEALRRKLTLQRSGAKTGLASNLYQDALARLASFSQWGTQSGIGSLSSAGNQYQGAGGTFTNLSQLGAQNAAGMGAGIGALVGMI